MNASALAYPAPRSPPPGPPKIRNCNIARSGATITVTGFDIAGAPVKISGVMHVTLSSGRIEARAATGIYELVL